MEIAGKRNKVHRDRRELDPKSMIQGVVRAQKCKHCSHHEIGIITGSGEYIPLKPGMKIAVSDDRKKKV